MSSGQAGAASLVHLLVQLLPFFLLALLLLLPFALLFRRMGRSPWWALIGFIPLALFALPWMAALMRWKDDPTR
jgi:uncharacterized membrane protein YhaH (DUF805 family)